MSYQEYPKVMTHPAEARAVVSQWDEKQKRHIPEHGIPAKFQPVTVHNRDQEDEYLAKGYRSSVSDPSAFDKAQASSEPSGYDFKEYPKWVGDKIVNSRNEEDELTGIFGTTPKKKSIKERTRVNHDALIAV